tara:strand:+ start:299 stop:604 length:306 start_codon:yes stop_codon:yes gene_type:complete
MRKFVTFEQNVVDTIKKSENKTTSLPPMAKIYHYDEIPGYTIRNERIYKVSEYKWQDRDWQNYNYWIVRLSNAGKLSRRKFFIMAAWDQAKGEKIRRDVIM